MKFNLPKEVEYCINTLETKGFEAFCVGGAVRDHVMERTPGDYDVTTNALPEDIIASFEKTVPTGIKHGTVTVIINKMHIEVTTYRTEGIYLDHRSPESVKFLNNVDGDLLRRDFTMNAIAYNPRDGLTDPYFGREDIEKRIVRAVRDPYLRFSEDALRILRALRFSATLGYEIEENTAAALRAKSHLLRTISAERIFTEWKKLLSGDFAYEVISNFAEVISVFIPELSELRLPKKECLADDFFTRQAQIFYLSCADPAADYA
jgi:tRNA nucleotidyltransferase (CCA-adding enzyme)